jgi:hypothetical protein
MLKYIVSTIVLDYSGRTLNDMSILRHLPGKAAGGGRIPDGTFEDPLISMYHVEGRMDKDGWINTNSGTQGSLYWIQPAEPYIGQPRQCWVGLCAGMEVAVRVGALNRVDRPGGTVHVDSGLGTESLQNSTVAREDWHATTGQQGPNSVLPYHFLESLLRSEGSKQSVYGFYSNNNCGKWMFDDPLSFSSAPEDNMVTLLYHQMVTGVMAGEGAVSHGASYTMEGTREGGTGTWVHFGPCQTYSGGYGAPVGPLLGVWDTLHMFSGKTMTHAGMNGASLSGNAGVESLEYSLAVG